MINLQRLFWLIIIHPQQPMLRKILIIETLNYIHCCCQSPFVFQLDITSSGGQLTNSSLRHQPDVAKQNPYFLVAQTFYSSIFCFDVVLNSVSDQLFPVTAAVLSTIFLNTLDRIAGSRYCVLLIFLFT